MGVEFIVIGSELRNALHAENPTHFKELIGPDTVSECLAFCEDEEALVLRALSLQTLSMYNSNFAQTGNKVIFPKNLGELTDVRGQGTYGGYTIGAVEGLSAAVNGLRVALGELYSPHEVSAGVYISETGDAVFPPHPDGNPVLAVQLKGSKRFGFPEFEAGAALEPGDGLFIPEGVVHSTTTVRDSVHLCIDILPQDFFN
ncbi:MAG TPA: hypothetical protein VK694_03950 [Verrucomicrobiae bacterium]|nr:hypothetical protein [Verrucomicrobiae bacterium]